MKRRFLVCAISLLIPLGAAAQLRGTVYLDANRNGVRDGNEKGVSGVSVSDGKHVVKTDARGGFELPAYADARFVSVTTPSGYRPAVQHYLPVNEASGSYDFGLVADGNTGAFEFIQITDTETPNYKGWIDELKEYVQSNPTAFIMHTGDICYIPGLEFHGVNVRTRQMGVPMYYINGNHDLVAGDYGEQVYERLFGPVWYSFEVGNVHFLCLPMLGGDHAPSYRPAQIVEWMKNDLANTDPGKRIIIFDHDLWLQGGDAMLRLGRRDSLEITSHKLEAFIYGHWHNHYLKEVAGVKTFCSSTPDKGGIDHSPACFRVFSIDAQGRVSQKTRSRYTNIAGTLTTALPAQHDTLAPVGGVIPVRVNAYRTVSPATAVKVTLMENGRRGRSTQLRPDTDWAWSGSLAVGSAAGARTILVEASFADGTHLVEHRNFMVGTATGVTLEGDRGNLGGNAQRSGVAAGPDRASYYAAPRPVWSQSAGGNIYLSSPVVGEGKVFVATMDDDNLQKCRIVAYDAVSGRELWSYKTVNSIKNTIVYSDGMVYACDAQMMAYGLDASTGRLVWSRELTQNILPENVHGLAVENGMVYAGQGGGFAALDAKNGSVIWKNTEWSGGEGTTSTTTVGEGIVLVSAHWNGLFAHQASDGKLLWKKQDGQIRFRDGSAAIYDGNVYLASSNTLYLINPRSGDILKSAAFENVSFHAAGAPVVTDKTIYIPTSDKGVIAVDRLSFKQKWNYRTSPALFYSVPYSQDYEMAVETSPVLIGNTLVFGASDGYLYGLDAETGRFCWKRNLGAPVFSSPAVSGDALYISDFSGNVYCLKL